MRMNQPNSIESLWLARMNRLVDLVRHADQLGEADEATKLMRDQVARVYGQPIPRDIPQLDRCRCAAEDVTSRLEAIGTVRQLVAVHPDHAGDAWERVAAFMAEASLAESDQQLELRRVQLVALVDRVRRILSAAA